MKSFFFIENLRTKITSFFPEGSIKARLGVGAFWALIATLLTQGFSFLAAIITARILGKTGFGELGMVVSTAVLFNAVAGLGLGMTATKYVAEFRVKEPERAGKILGMSTIVALCSGSLLAIALYFLSPWLSAKTLQAPHLENYLRIACLLMFFSALNGAQMGALSGFEAFKTVARVNFLQGLINFPFMVIGVVYWGLTGAVWGRVFAAAVGWLFNHIAVRLEAKKAGIPISYRKIKSEIPILWRFSIYSLLSGIIMMLVTWVGNAMLVNKANGYAQLGIFNAANQWQMILMFLPSVFSLVITPIMSNTLGEGRKDSAKKVMFTTLGLIGFCVLIPGILLAFLSPFIMEQYGEGFREGWPVLIACLINALLMGIQTPIKNMIVASGKMRTGFLINLSWGISFLVIFYYLREYGAMGMALSFLFSYIFQSFMTVSYAYFRIVK